MERFIIQDPDPRLRRDAEKVSDFQLGNDIVDKMLEIAYRIRSEIYQYPRGFEMAAPQIGESHRILILQGDYYPQPNEIETIAMINPEIVKETDFFYNWEDCLSINNMRGYVERCRSIHVKYHDLSGQLHEGEFLDTMACDIQHGVDHLNGMLHFERKMKYFVPLAVYRPLKDQGLDVLNKYIVENYELFDSNQYLSSIEMKECGLVHPRECLKKKSNILS
ncbi:MAG: peptide deformylase [Pseudomonadales bacterium]